MNCNEICELLPDLAAGMSVAIPEINQHLSSCNKCATDLLEFKKIMAVLDEWSAPEPSPYFDVRLQARLREEAARPQSAWFGWLRQPARAMSMAAVMVAGALTIGIANKSYFVESAGITTKPPALSLPVQPGTAVGDLQALDRNDELYADFDVLDDLQVQDDVTANP